MYNYFQKHAQVAEIPEAHANSPRLADDTERLAVAGLSFLGRTASSALDVKNS